ncbi:MAG: acetamidase/formamidase family protein [Anaerolineae bacterium]|jgi:acetamidase/formamidase|nr:acetamidase/formamidase family protein [Anaerolineae bacterium]
MTIHTFVPTTYYTTFGSHAPALRIADGDTVVTTTLDARGYDARLEQVTPPGNPQTGPFYVEGAEPGDAIAIVLEHLAPNRDTGWTSTQVAPNVVVPECVPLLPEREIVTWHLEARAPSPNGGGLGRGKAWLVEPMAGLEGLVLPLAPMLGCLGVAPSGGQAISTATSGPYGGNMDYRGYVAGVTAYFPVFVPGALIHLGDGHAVQGDGEIVGTGIETSFDVRFTVHVLKGKDLWWPRGEDADCIWAVGNARPLDQALQIATTELLRWLGADYGMDLKVASTLLGQVIAYDVGNVYDPAYTMVARVAKSVLPTR